MLGMSYLNFLTHISWIDLSAIQGNYAGLGGSDVVIQAGQLHSS